MLLSMGEMRIVHIGKVLNISGNLVMPPKKYPDSERERELNRAMLDGHPLGEDVFYEKYFPEIKNKVKLWKQFKMLVRVGYLDYRDHESIAYMICRDLSQQIRRVWVKKSFSEYSNGIINNVLNGIYRQYRQQAEMESFSLDDYRINDSGDLIRQEQSDTIETGKLDISDALVLVMHIVKGKVKPMHWMMFCLKYFEEVMNKTVADIFGYSESRPSQITMKMIEGPIREYIENSSLIAWGDFYDGLQAIYRAASSDRAC